MGAKPSQPLAANSAGHCIGGRVGAAGGGGGLQTISSNSGDGYDTAEKGCPKHCLQPPCKGVKAQPFVDVSAIQVSYCLPPSTVLSPPHSTGQAHRHLPHSLGLGCKVSLPPLDTSAVRFCPALAQCLYSRAGVSFLGCSFFFFHTADLCNVDLQPPGRDAA